MPLTMTTATEPTQSGGVEPFSQVSSTSPLSIAGSTKNGDCDLNVIRNNSYFYAIRAVASLYNLFEETVKEQSELTVVIDSVAQLQGHGALDDPDYFVNVGINEVWFTNEGTQGSDEVVVTANCRSSCLHGQHFTMKQVLRSGWMSRWL